MIHQSKLFVCPGSHYGIAWNICLGRQDAEFDACSMCPYAGWHEKGLPGFNPYIGAFAESQDLRDYLEDAPKQPACGRIYDQPVKSFLPEDIGLEEPRPKRRSMIGLLRQVYDAI